MTREELQAAVDHTKDQIYQVKQQIEKTTDPREKRRLKRRLKESQKLQLRHIDQLKGMEQNLKAAEILEQEGFLFLV